MLALPLIALVAASLFTGAAAYISLVEHPARLVLDEGPLLDQWKPSYDRALPIQSGLAIVGGLAGVAAWYQSVQWLWVAGSVALLANWPFTLLAIMPTNKRLKVLQAGVESRALLLKWGRLHNFRSGLGALATLLFAAASLQTT
ncbi:MAG: hypothetical protein QOJ91_1609 [Sphingomonadales bacterium]|jgi:hypothetical protein|nr:hypothetical protein [Sphingomonadales bacterium]